MKHQCNTCEHEFVCSLKSIESLDNCKQYLPKYINCEHCFEWSGTTSDGASLYICNECGKRVRIKNFLKRT